MKSFMHGKELFGLLLKGWQHTKQGTDRYGNNLVDAKLLGHHTVWLQAKLKMKSRSTASKWYSLYVSVHVFLLLSRSKNVEFMNAYLLLPSGLP